LPRWCCFSGPILATVVAAAVAGAATVAVSVLIYGTHPTVSGAFVAFILGSLAWTAAATALTPAIPTLEAAARAFSVTDFSVTDFPVIITSGVFGAISEPHWLFTIASYLAGQPLTHAVGSALGHTSRQAWLPARDLIVLAAWAIAGLVIAQALTVRWKPHRSIQGARPSPHVRSARRRPRPEVTVMAAR
jgi:hypothetical protein